MQSPPRVSIGLFVYNGENYLAEAIDAILAQTFRDFELIITDNLSTDATPDICRAYMARDPRISFHVNVRNLGPNLNANRGLELARGEYFKWAAHDDLLAPTFLERCVAELDADPGVVLCQSLVSIIDDHGQEIFRYDSSLDGADAGSQSARFAPLVLKRHICTEMFGVYRREALLKTRTLTGNYHGCDRAMLAELALVGRFRQIRESLFLNREHHRRYVRAVPASERAQFHDDKTGTKIELSSLKLYRDYLAAVRRHVTDRRERLRCRFILLRWWFVAWNAPRFAAELVSRVVPRFYNFSKRINDRWLKPQHPTVASGSPRKKH